MVQIILAVAIGISISSVGIGAGAYFLVCALVHWKRFQAGILTEEI